MMNYFLPISMGRLTAVIASGGVIWAFRNDPAKNKLIRVNRIFEVVGYDGNGTPDSAQYGLHRFNGAAFTGGTAFTPAKSSTKLGASAVVDARQASGAALTLGSAVVESVPLHHTMNQRSSSATTSGVHRFRREEAPVLYPGEGLCIKLAAASVVGDYISGYVCWSEENIL